MSDLLIVDDTPNNLRLLMDLMVDQGYDVRTATNGKMALRSAQASIPDLILLDINMPNMDGYEVCQQLKANPKTQLVPVIFLSALSEVLDKVKAFEVGGIDYVTKPIQVEEVLVRVKTQLTLCQMKRQLEQTIEVQSTELDRAQLQLIQSEKMASLGNMVAGVAHELNNPIGFLSGSVRNAQTYIKDLFGHIDLYEELCPDSPKAIQEDAEDIDLDFLREDIPKLLDSMNGAMVRMRNISTSLRVFSRADTDEKTSADLHESLDSTLLILKYRLKANDNRPDIDIVRDYGELSPVQCFPGQLNQVFMNILANAIDMFDEVAQSAALDGLKPQPQAITIQTRTLTEQSAIEILIRDNGKGMSEAVRSRIFDRLYTTKGVGKGTGLGLAISQQIVVEAHDGEITVSSELGQGSEFCIRLPSIGEISR